ncbi:DUF397 domain-containing protein [Streptomyces sp. WMMB 322]|uniref:DUF397 domain-containing protein n=1 Tax=Streptomyces sp. WMMB 322 TaxID=1286821 RepID=UPI0006E19AEF|nr:DUF397 domain-containing protein [Streptomyces sp. WMMB 322]SCK51656.1 protein of unknown function [Streptomyces sp. WMMB 322]
MTLKSVARNGSTPQWIKSSYSSNDGPECVEVAAVAPGTVRVRDSKDVAGPQLAFGAASWSAFTELAARCAASR